MGEDLLRLAEVVIGNSEHQRRRSEMFNGPQDPSNPTAEMLQQVLANQQLLMLMLASLSSNEAYLRLHQVVNSQMCTATPPNTTSPSLIFKRNHD